MNTPKANLLLVGLVGGAIALGSTLSACKSMPQSPQAGWIKGDARISSDKGETWRPLARGAVITDGAFVQTAQGSHAFITLDEIVKDRLGAPYDPSKYPSTFLRLNAATLLQIRQAQPTPLGDPANSLADLRLGLPIGSMLCNVPEKIDTPTLRVVVTNGIIDLTGGVYRISAGGEVGIYYGSAFLRMNDGSTRRVAAGRKFRIATGTEEEWPRTSPAVMHDLWLPHDEFYVPWSNPPKSAPNELDTPTIAPMMPRCPG
jgi:hypothetical protein